MFLYPSIWSAPWTTFKQNSNVNDREGWFTRQQTLHAAEESSSVLLHYSVERKNKTNKKKNNKDKAEPDSETTLPVQKMYLERDTEAFF